MIAKTINNQVVHNTAVLVAHGGILCPEGRQFANIVDGHFLQIGGGIFATDEKLSHVRNVKNANRISYALMFFFDTPVLHRHAIAAELDHLGAKPDVNLVQCCLFRLQFVSLYRGAYSFASASLMRSKPSPMLSMELA
ncbi:hypothetical protein MnTg02_01224 [bacterium MnTg02]|nr:hypothetical protein MnTg02_01224 [bacterium MnTg02]